MNNNDYLKKFLRSYTNEELTLLGTNRTEINSAGGAILRDLVTRLKHDPDQIIADGKAGLTPVSSGSSPAMSDAEAKVKAMQELLGGGSVDPDQVADIVKDVIKSDVQPSIDDITTKVDALSPLAETLEKIADAMSTSTNNRLPLATAVASGKTPILDLVAPYYKAGAENPTMLCVSAPPSYGKSYSVGLLGESYDTFITHGCSGDMDEWSMLLGSCTPKKEGGFITVDGKLAEAVRSASDGKNTLLFLDEVFRMSATTMESMLSFLAPQPDSSGDLVYQLTTKQNDGGVLETLTCKADKLHIICATNLSEVEPPEAFMDRFLFKHIQYSKDFIKDVSQGVAEKYLIGNADKLAEAFADAMGASREMHGTGQIKKPLSIRDLKRACTHSISANATGVANWLTVNGMDGLLMWNSDTGDIIKDSENGVQKLATILNR